MTTRTIHHRHHHHHRRPWTAANVVTVVALVCLVTLVPSTAAAGDAASFGAPKTKKILSFGGNGMIGSHVLGYMIAANKRAAREEANSRGTSDGHVVAEPFEITLVSRGSWDFQTDKTIKPYVKFVHCDRGTQQPDDDDEQAYESNNKKEPQGKNALEQCDGLMQEIAKTEDEYYAVLDFSGYHPQWVRDALHVLQGKARVYVYVSTDSVYEVCEPALGKKQGFKTLESEAKRPDDPALRHSLEHGDDGPYATKKLEGEEALQEFADKIPYVALRFGDVVGPRDFSLRFWTIYCLVKLYHILDMGPIIVPAHLAKLTSSITYVEDAAQAILASMDRPDAWNEAYNIACEDDFTMVTAIETLATLLDVQGVETQIAKDHELSSSYVADSYPSVVAGPIDVDKAKQRLDFQPTPMRKVFTNTIAWYENVGGGANIDQDQWDDFMNQFLEEIMDGEDEEDIEEVLEEIKEALGNSHGADEL